MTSPFPTALYTCEQSRELDRLAMSKGKIPGIVLMKRAGRVAFDVLQLQWPGVEKLIVFCGGGNNGGDGYIVAGLARAKNLSVDLYTVSDSGNLKGDAALARDFALAQGVEIRSADNIEWPDQPQRDSSVIVDAVLGTGFQGELKQDLATLFSEINRSGLPVLSLDIPSGLEGDTGNAASNALMADATISFVGVKQGLLTGRGPALCGALSFDDLGIPSSIYDEVTPSVTRIQAPKNIFSQRPADAHKKDFGHVLVIGGDFGMGGAAMMAAESALRCGAGLVSVATQPEHVSALLARLPEVMVKGVSAGEELEPLLKRADVVVVGPGLGRSVWSQQLLYFALQNALPKVMDADALNILAEAQWDLPKERQWVMTPHPGEAARLLGCSTTEVQENRFDALIRLQQQFECTVLIKGAGTLIGDGRATYLADVGNPGMAVAGMGDVLSGVLGALLAQGMTASKAARVGVCLHGDAGNRAAEKGQRGILATDVIPYLRQLVNG